MPFIALSFPREARGQPYLDNETLYSNQDPNTETRRSEHFRFCFGHFNRDTGTPMTEQLAQGNLQMFEQMWHRWVVELGLHDINVSATQPDGNKYRANFNVLMTWNDGGGGGAYSSMDANGFFYAMANSGYCRFDPPSGATPHEFGHAWQGTGAGFNGSDSSGSWWEGHANWMQLQFLNTYPQAAGYIYNGMYYPSHGRDYYDSFMIWETAREDTRYGAAWVNNVWTNADASQRVNEYMLDRMIRCDTSGSPDQAGAMKDLWGEMAKKLVTWDFERQRWLATANKPDDGTHWEFYQRARTPLVKVPGTNGWYRPARAHLPMQFGFNLIPLAAAPNTTVTCDFQPLCDPVRQSDWRASLVAVNTAGEASYSAMWSIGTNSITLSPDHQRLYLVVIATPKPMKIADPVWNAYLTDAGRQFPYAVSFANASPKNVAYARPASGVTWKTFINADGTRCTNVASGAVIDSTVYVSPTAMILGTPQIRGTARIEDFAVVKDNARITNAVISGHALVEGNARVYGNAKVRDWARVFGHAEVFENGRVIEHANCGDGNATTHTKVYGNAVIKGTTYVYDTSTLNGCLIMDGDSANGNGTTPSSKGVHFGWGWGQDVNRFNALPDNGYLYAQHTFEKDNAVFALDEFGINHGFLMNGCRAEPDLAAPERGGRVLPLNGVNQYVELHSSVNDFKDMTVAVWVKWTGTTSGQRIWSMGDGGIKAMYLTTEDGTTGGLRFVITDGVITNALAGGGMTPNVWTHIAVVYSGGTCTLFIDGTPVAANPAMTLFPEDLNAPLMENANYLGRGNDGDYFEGFLDDFRVYMKSLSAGEIAALASAPSPAPVGIVADTTPPTPDAAGWLVEPNAIRDDVITMSAIPGEDASGWVEYYFTCTSGNGQDSGWVSFNKYTDVGVTPGTPATYTVKMRDRNGNVTAPSTPASAMPIADPLPTPGFSYGPVGIANNQVTMTAQRVTNRTARIEYKFDRIMPSGGSSGWQSSPTWTQTGLTAGASYSYTVMIRDGHGGVSAPSSAGTGIARDEAAPRLPIPVAHWEMLPYATIDNRISMTAMAATDASGMEYQFHCVSGGGPDSAWQGSRTFLTPVLPDGEYVYQYRVRDTSAQRNESGYSTSYTARITPTSGYHSYSLSQVLTQPDDYLVSFPATVMKASSNHYYVKDLADGTSIKVRPSTSNQVTDVSLALKNVQVKGHLYTFGGVREVTFSTVSLTGSPTLYTIGGQVTNSSGAPVSGATVYFADVPGASSNAIVTATTDAAGHYSRGVTPGTWYVAAGASALNTSTDRTVLVESANVGGVNFVLVPNARIRGRVFRRSDGMPVVGAAVYFSRAPGASASPAFTTTVDGAGHYSQGVQDGIWYVCAGGSGFYTSPDQTITVRGADVPQIDFSLKASARNIPRTDDLLFSALTETFPSSGLTGPWATQQPAGQTLMPMGTPAVELLNGVKWVNNVYGEGDGYRFARYAEPIPVNGMSIVVAVRPDRNTTSTSWTSIVDIFYQRLVLGIRNNTGRIDVWRNNTLYLSSSAIPDGQATILSLVVQPDGAFKVHANGVPMMNITATSPMTSLNPDFTETWGNDPDFTHYINVGRNNPDGWTTFNGNIGDVFVYTVAITDAERQQLEADLTAKFRATDHVIFASASPGGAINPSGTVYVGPGGTQSFSLVPMMGYALTNVLVDGIAQGAVTAYTFTNVTANHVISASFASAPLTPPTLEAFLQADGLLRITWPDTYTGHLVQSTVPDARAPWSPVEEQPVHVGNRFQVTIAPGHEAMFFALEP